MTTDGLDVIGDVHGHAEQLTTLLERLGYRYRDRAWRHASRTAVFVGDLIDRGPSQVETMTIVRSMIEAGTARMVLGNHEFNAVAWNTFDPARGDHCRTHNDRHRKQHQTFLHQVGEGTPTHKSWVDWFSTIPLWLDLGGLRVVHACWDPGSMHALTSLLSDTGTLTPDLVIASTTPPDRKMTGATITPYDAIESVLKGPEIALGDGRSYLDKDGHERHNARFTWWDPNATTLRDAAVIPPNVTTPDATPFPELPETPLGDDAPYRYQDDTPVLFGHYWCNEHWNVLTPTTMCVDYSVAKGGTLAAYQWHGEQILDPNKLVKV